MQQLNLKPAHKAVRAYYETLGQFGQLSIDYEMAVRSAFQGLLATCGRQFEWTRRGKHPVLGTGYLVLRTSLTTPWASVR